MTAAVVASLPRTWSLASITNHLRSASLTLGMCVVIGTPLRSSTQVANAYLRRIPAPRQGLSSCAAVVSRRSGLGLIRAGDLDRAGGGVEGALHGDLRADQGLDLAEVVEVVGLLLGLVPDLRLRAG